MVQQLIKSNMHITQCFIVPLTFGKAKELTKQLCHFKTSLEEIFIRFHFKNSLDHYPDKLKVSTVKL